MARWVVVAHLIVEAETPEEASALAEAAFATHPPGPTPGFAVAGVERLPEAPRPSRPPRDERAPAP